MKNRLAPALTIHADGTFDIHVGGLALRHAYPAIDHESIHPTGIKIDRRDGQERITYQLLDGAAMTVMFSREREDLAVSAVLSGMATAPHWVHPVAAARLEGAERFFRTGIGFSGPTNFVNLTTQQDHYSFESYLFTGLVAADRTTMAVSVRDVDNFMQKSHVENRLYHGQFRNRDIVWNVPYFEAGFSTERVPLPETRLKLPTLYFSAAANSWSALRQAATDTARVAGGRVTTPAYHICTCYQRGEHYTQQDLQQLLAGLAKKPDPVQYIQIDGGFCTFWGDWLDPHPYRFPDGMQKAFQEIQRHGYVPGIWIGPYMVSNRSRIAKEHPEWLLHWKDGSLVTEWRLYNFPRDEEEVYVLDTSHPEAMAYLDRVFRTLRSWGVKFFKTDFLEWGYKDSTLVRRHTPGKTATQYFRDVMRMIRDAIGQESHWLGCITYFAPCVGFTDSMRIGSDVGLSWNDAPGGNNTDGCGGGTQNGIEESYGCQFFNNVLWQNDPDMTMFRDYFINLDDGEIHALAYWNGILGVSMNTPEDFQRLTSARLNLWHFVRPQATPWTASLPYWEGGSQLKVAVREFPALQSWAVVLLNDSHTKITERMCIADWIGQPSAFLYEWGPEGAKPLGQAAQWIAEVTGHRAVLLYLSSNNAPPPPNLTLGGHQ